MLWFIINIWTTRERSFYMNNQDIRKKVKEAGLYLWQVAERRGYTDSAFSRKLRHELPQEEKERIRQIIKELKEGTYDANAGMRDVYGRTPEGRSGYSRHGTLYPAISSK